MLKESDYQHDVLKKIKLLLNYKNTDKKDNCIIMKEDPRYIQGIPDWIILYKNKWATLEIKRSKHEKHQPNQDNYVDKMNYMSCSYFLFPENEIYVIKHLLLFFEKQNVVPEEFIFYTVDKLEKIIKGEKVANEF